MHTDAQTPICNFARTAVDCRCLFRAVFARPSVVADTNLVRVVTHATSKVAALRGRSARGSPRDRWWPIYRTLPRYLPAQLGLWHVAIRATIAAIALAGAIHAGATVKPTTQYAIAIACSTADWDSIRDRLFVCWAKMTRPCARCYCRCLPLTYTRTLRRVKSDGRFKSNALIEMSVHPVKL